MRNDGIWGGHTVISFLLIRLLSRLIHEDSDLVPTSKGIKRCPDDREAPGRAKGAWHTSSNSLDVFSSIKSNCSLQTLQFCWRPLLLEVVIRREGCRGEMNGK